MPQASSAAFCSLAAFAVRRRRLLFVAILAGATIVLGFVAQIVSVALG
jgi:hypothetical protein